MMARKSVYWFFVPGTLLYLLLFVYPTAKGLMYSVTDWDGMSETFRYVGLGNYRHVAEDIVFRKALGNNLKFMVSVVIVQTVVSLVIALLLARNTRTHIALRALYFFPAIISSVAVGFIAAYIYDPTLGLLNGALGALHLESWRHNWIGDPKLAIFSVAAVQVWAHIGQMAMLFIAGLQSIPEELYEAARLDGGSRWQVFARITWPLLAPAATIVAAYTTIQSFKAFDLIFVMTKGGPAYSTEILATFIYSSAFQNYKFGQASAASVYFLAIVSIVTLLQFRVLRSNRISY
jgi:raffinose/stachyose/melibiose transport system permease protein